MPPHFERAIAGRLCACNVGCGNTAGQELVADTVHDAGPVHGEFEKGRPPVVRIDNRPDAALGEIDKED